MSLLEPKYKVNTREGGSLRLTAKQLTTRVLEDSESDYNWIASASELVRVCQSTGFPQEYATVIMMTILNCYGNIYHTANNGGDLCKIDPNDKKAIEECFNRLRKKKSESVQLTREYWLKERIDFITRNTDNPHSWWWKGKEYETFRSGWIDAKVADIISREVIVSDVLFRQVAHEYEIIRDDCIEQGLFEQDRVDYRESLNKVCEMIRNMDV